MKKLSFLGISLGLLLSLASCSRDSNKRGPLARPISDEQLKEELITLSDTLIGKWQVMYASDSLKIQEMQELLAAMPPALLTPEHRSNLQKAIRRLPTLRYDRHTMRNSDLIDAYDMAHDSVWSALRAFLPDSGSTGSYLVDSLHQQIQRHHDQVIFYRGKYDMTAKELNTLLRRYRKRLPGLGKPYDTLQPAPLFQWVEKKTTAQLSEEAAEEDEE